MFRRKMNSQSILHMVRITAFVRGGALVSDSLLALCINNFLILIEHINLHCVFAAPKSRFETLVLGFFQVLLLPLLIIIIPNFIWIRFCYRPHCLVYNLG